MTYPSKRCQHGWLDPSACETCKLLAEVTALRAAYIEADKHKPGTWIGLTDDEIIFSIDTYPDGGVYEICRSVEAALKAKNDR